MAHSGALQLLAATYQPASHLPDLWAHLLGLARSTLMSRADVAPALVKLTAQRGVGDRIPSAILASSMTGFQGLGSQRRALWEIWGPELRPEQGGSYKGAEGRDKLSG